MSVDTMLLVSTTVFLASLRLWSVAAQDAVGATTSGAISVEAAVPVGGSGQSAGLAPPRQNVEKSMFRPYITTTIDEGYIFVGGASFPPGMRPAELLEDPDVQFGQLEFASLGIGRSNASDLPYGPLDWAWFLFSGSYRDSSGRGYRSGFFTQVWASNTAYCNSSIFSQAPLVMECRPAVFDWHTLSDLGNKDINLYDPSDLSSPILSIKGIVEMPFSQFWMPNTAMWIPPFSGFRLFIMGGIVPVTEGVNEDGSPKITGHVVFDSDLEGPVALSAFDGISGPAASKFSALLYPVGMKLKAGHSLRIGHMYLTPEQQSIPAWP